MKSIEVIVPRKLIVDFMQHPELYGDYIVELQNGMHTDVYYREEGDFITKTNDEELIHYLRNEENNPQEYIFRNGVFAFRNIFPEDGVLICSWYESDYVIYEKLFNLEERELKKLRGLPKKILLTFYWIEVGIMELEVVDNLLNAKTVVFEATMIEQIEIEIFHRIMKEYLKS